MVMTDPVADMLTRIRNAGQAGHRRVEMPTSGLKVSIARILRQEGYIREFKNIDLEGPQDNLRIWLKYGDDGKPAVQGLKRISRPGLRRYVSSQEIPRVLGGLGVAILSTSRGVMSSKLARSEKLGGEVLCYVW